MPIDPGASPIIIHSLTLGELAKVLSAFFAFTWAIMSSIGWVTWKIRTNDLKHIDANLKDIRADVKMLIDHLLPRGKS